jgi:hypothetical protein
MTTVSTIVSGVAAAGWQAERTKLARIKSDTNTNNLDRIVILLLTG